MSLNRFPADAQQVVIDVFRIEGGLLAEHWDVLQNEVPVTSVVGGISMFDPEEARGSFRRNRHD